MRKALHYSCSAQASHTAKWHAHLLCSFNAGQEEQRSCPAPTSHPTQVGAYAVEEPLRHGGFVWLFLSYPNSLVHPTLTVSFPSNAATNRLVPMLLRSMAALCGCSMAPSRCQLRSGPPSPQHQSWRTPSGAQVRFDLCVLVQVVWCIFCFEFCFKSVVRERPHLSPPHLSWRTPSGGQVRVLCLNFVFVFLWFFVDLLSGCWGCWGAAALPHNTRTGGPHVACR
jgi:hypothetical protein